MGAACAGDGPKPPLSSVGKPVGTSPRAEAAPAGVPVRASLSRAAPKPLSKLPQVNWNHSASFSDRDGKRSTGTLRDRNSSSAGCDRAGRGSGGHTARRGPAAASPASRRKEASGGGQGSLRGRWRGGYSLPPPPLRAHSRTHGFPGDGHRRALRTRRVPPAGRAEPRPEARCQGRSSASN